MTPKKLFRDELIIFSLSLAHGLIALLIYPMHPVAALLGALLIIANIVALLWYFSLSIQLLMAYRLKRKIMKNPFVLYTALPVIIVFSALIYLWLIILFAIIQLVFVA